MLTTLDILMTATILVLLITHNKENVPPILGYMAFYHDAMDRWFDEDEEIIGHPHDLYHRVDVLVSSRHVRAKVKGEMVAKPDRPKILFETGLPPRYYFPLEDARTELLVESGTKTVARTGASVCTGRWKWTASAWRTPPEDIQSLYRRPRRSKGTCSSTMTSGVRGRQGETRVAQKSDNI